jgi:hypothetical protein
MSDLLAIFSDPEADAEVLAGISANRPNRVTVLMADENQELMADESSQGDALRDRMAVLMQTIERSTGATVIGVAGDRTQLDGWRFDRELGAPLPVAA